MERKIQGGGGNFVPLSYFMCVTYCHVACFRHCRLLKPVLKMVFGCLWVVVDFLRWLLKFLRCLQMVVGGCRWLQVVPRFSNYDPRLHEQLSAI